MTNGVRRSTRWGQLLQDSRQLVQQLWTRVLRRPSDSAPCLREQHYPYGLQSFQQQQFTSQSPNSEKLPRHWSINTPQQPLQQLQQLRPFLQQQLLYSFNGSDSTLSLSLPSQEHSHSCPQALNLAPRLSLISPSSSSASLATLSQYQSLWEVQLALQEIPDMLHENLLTPLAGQFRFEDDDETSDLVVGNGNGGGDDRDPYVSSVRLPPTTDPFLSGLEPTAEEKGFLGFKEKEKVKGNATDEDEDEDRGDKVTYGGVTVGGPPQEHNNNENKSRHFRLENEMDYCPHQDGANRAPSCPSLLWSPYSYYPTEYARSLSLGPDNKRVAFNETDNNVLLNGDRLYRQQEQTCQRQEEHMSLLTKTETPQNQENDNANKDVVVVVATPGAWTKPISVTAPFQGIAYAGDSTRTTTKTRTVFLGMSGSPAVASTHEQCGDDTTAAGKEEVKKGSAVGGNDERGLPATPPNPTKKRKEGDQNYHRKKESQHHQRSKSESSLASIQNKKGDRHDRKDSGFFMHDDEEGIFLKVNAGSRQQGGHLPQNRQGPDSGSGPFSSDESDSDSYYSEYEQEEEESVFGLTVRLELLVG
ncbi:hypothetical protein BGZ83_001934 [Gryganskiella cystojenkinii]|nr:hypothetical protein BGZ83_001934 [Gryganskiella cystojenkinii]